MQLGIIFRYVIKIPKIGFIFLKMLDWGEKTMNDSECKRIDIIFITHIKHG